MPELSAPGALSEMTTLLSTTSYTSAPISATPTCVNRPLASITTLSIALISGGVVSTILTVCTTEAEFPDSSVAVHCISVSPSGYGPGLFTSMTTSSPASSLTSNSTNETDVNSPDASNSTSPGTLPNSGAVVSCQRELSNG